MYVWLVALFLLWFSNCESRLYNVTVSLGKNIVNTTEETFISFNLDYYQVLNGLNYSSTQLTYLTKELAPSLIRVGGTDGDFAYYEVGNEKPCNLPPAGYDDGNYWNYTCLSMEKFTNFVSWCKQIDAKLIWSLSVGYPLYPNISSKYWNSTNSRQFLEYLHNVMNYTSSDIYGFGIGNEINNGDPFTNATWQANAFIELNNILTQLWGKNHSFKLIGPDPHSATVRPNSNATVFNYIPHFFNLTCDILYGGDYHVYINLANSTDYITPNGLNIQLWESQRIMNEIDYSTSDCFTRLKDHIYVGEISPVNHQFEWEYTEMINKYWDGFWWLDAIGGISKIGQKNALRWRLYAENYTVSYNKNLLGNHYIPNPDYYTSLLFMSLMSTNVLDIKSNNEYFRIYSHCTSMNINRKIYNNNELTLINPVSMSYVSLFNETNANVNIFIDEINDLLKGDVLVWILTPGNTSAPNNGLESTTIALHNQTLVLNSDGKLPSLEGVVININEQNNAITIPGMTYGYFVFTQTNIHACSL